MTPKIFKSKRFLLLFYLLLLVLVGGIIYFLSPTLFNIIFNVLRGLLVGLVILFVLVTFLVLIGLREQAAELIHRIIDGSLTSIDLYEALRRFGKNVWKRIKKMFRNLAPLYALVINLYLYFALMFLFRFVGSMYDVTLFTIVLTFSLVLLTAFLTRPKKQKTADTFRQDFTANFTDFFEIMLFVFFLTIDIEHLFFLPDALQVPLEAQIGDYNLMVRGINIYDHFGTTLNIILFIVIIELTRRALGFYIMAKDYQKELEANNYNGDVPILKLSLQRSLHGNIDDIIKFVTYITFVVFVFLFFPRLKLLAMAVASLAALFADFLFVDRLRATPEKKQDLIGRIINKLFRI